MGDVFDFIGKRIPSIDSMSKVTGSAKYIADLSLPGMLYGKFLRSPHAHARVVKIDTSRAEMLPGVKLVLTPDDIIGKTNPVGAARPRNQYALHREVRYVGDEVAAVAAVDEATAEEALELIQVTYEELPVVLDPEAAMVPGAPQLQEEARNNVRDLKRVRIGDIEKGLKEADYIVKGRFQTSKQVHAALDTHACLSSYDPATGKLTHWTRTQYVFYTRLSIAGALNMPASKVRVIAPPAIGGAFGNKSGSYAHDIAAAFMSRKLGQPVKMALSREEEFQATKSRHPFLIDAEIGLNKDGTIVAWREKAILDVGAYGDLNSWVALLGQAMAAGPYKIPNIWVDSYCVYTDKPVSGAMRGFGNPQITFARESLLDMAADQVGIDPVEIRLKNIIEPEDVPYTTSTGLIIRSCGIEECIKKAAQAVGWAEKRKPNTGVGMAGMMQQSGFKTLDADAEYATVNIELAADGSLLVRTGNSDVGQGLYTVLAQMAAEDLGIPLEEVTIIGADSEVTPPDLGCVSSRSPMTTGGALRIAAAEVKRKLFRIASNMLEVDPQDLVARQGKIHVKDMSRSVPIAEVAGAAYFTSVDGDAGPITAQGTWVSSTQPQNEDGYGNYAPCYAFAADAIEVEVEPATGEVKITKCVVAHDVGRTLNLDIVEGQLHGGAGMGIGYGLLEEGLVHASKTGQLLNPSIMSYKVPTALDLPDMQLILVETIDPVSPLGSKGVGDMGVACLAAAIANAIYDAVGVRITELPITPTKVLRALEAKREQSGT
ncbi:MAG: xanthine dehydrogenase family protein molybdopterin-binding subunit [Chloroflexi bacterium]|nr:xanthine dehydrogenase family protein molybdopterin-binding subunit [Chloroflexota bacterium]